LLRSAIASGGPTGSSTAIVSSAISIRRFDLDDDPVPCPSGETPYSIETDGIRGALVPTICYGVIEPTAKLVHQVLKDYPSLAEGGAREVNVCFNLCARDLSQVPPKFVRAD
jgi:hypothetical protein